MKPTKRLVRADSEESGIAVSRYKSIRKPVPSNVNNFDNNIFNSPSSRLQSLAGKDFFVSQPSKKVICLFTSREYT